MRWCVECGAVIAAERAKFGALVCPGECKRASERKVKAAAHLKRKANPRPKAPPPHLCSRQRCRVETTPGEPICRRHLVRFDREPIALPPRRKRRATLAEIEAATYGDSWSNVE